MSDMVEFERLETLISAAYANAHVPAGAIVLPNQCGIVSTERFRTHRDRKRGVYATTLVEDFANYFARNAVADKLGHAPIFIDPKAMRAVALFDWLVEDDLPGHVEHLGACQLEALPEWAALIARNNDTLSQASFVDFLEDFAGLITAFDDKGAGLSASQLIGAFRSVKVTRKSEHAQQLEESSTRRSAFEEIEAGASIGTPSKMQFHVVPYTGFKGRAVVVRVTVRASGDAPFFQLRIVSYEYLQHELAVEFVKLVESSIAQFYQFEPGESGPPSDDSAPVIYVGTMSRLAEGFKNSTY
jgi:uncharacterized protein YfdQ (DUF2303 family)